MRATLRLLVVCTVLMITLSTRTVNAFGPDPSPVECSNCTESEACQKATHVAFPAKDSSGSKNYKIPSQAFEGCTNVVSAEIPDGVQFIGASAFQGCTSLTARNLHQQNQNGAKTGFEMCFAIGLQHLWSWGRNPRLD